MMSQILFSSLLIILDFDLILTRKKSECRIAYVKPTIESLSCMLLFCSMEKKLLQVALIAILEEVKLKDIDSIRYAWLMKVQTMVCKDNLMMSVVIEDFSFINSSAMPIMAFITQRITDNYSPMVELMRLLYIVVTSHVSQKRDSF